MDVYYADVRINDLIKVLNVKRSILPPRENYSYDVPNRHGSYYGGYRYLPREIEVEFMILNRNVNESMRMLAWMLNMDEPSILRFSDEPNRYYYAVIDGATDIERVSKHGEGSLTFLCLDPFSYSSIDQHFSYNPTEKNFIISNEGTAPARPRFDITFSGDCGYLALVSPNGVIQIGNPKEVDGIVIPPSETLLSDPMETTSGWTVNTGGKVLTSGAKIQGTVKTVGNPAYGITANSYGAATEGWHGMTIRKNLPTFRDGTNTAQYWQVNYTFEFGTEDLYRTGGQKQVGRMEFSIMDENNNFIANFTMRDHQQGHELNIPEFYVGTKKIWTDSPTIPEPRRVRQYNKTKKKWEYKNVPVTQVGKWNDFYGKVIIIKTGGKITFELQKIDKKTGKLIRRATKTYYDNSGTFNNIKAKTINIWFGKFAARMPMSKLSANHITFRKDNTENWLDIPNTFSNGDHLHVDCETSQIYLNDALYMDTLDIGSQFFELEEGDSEVRMFTSSYGSIAAAEATITERFL